MTGHDINEIFLKVTLDTHNLDPYSAWVLSSNLWFRTSPN